MMDHGYSWYIHGGCRCDVCRTASREYHRARRARNRQARQKVIKQANEGADVVNSQYQTGTAMTNWQYQTRTVAFVRLGDAWVRADQVCAVQALPDNEEACILVLPGYEMIIALKPFQAVEKLTAAH